MKGLLAALGQIELLEVANGDEALRRAQRIALTSSSWTWACRT